jgi:hypothetical protein
MRSRRAKVVEINTDETQFTNLVDRSLRAGGELLPQLWSKNRFLSTVEQRHPGADRRMSRPGSQPRLQIIEPPDI